VIGEGEFRPGPRILAVVDAGGVRPWETPVVY
jgi:hypothetical protein